MQVARKVRNKLNCGRKSASSPLDSSNVASLERKSVELSKNTKEKKLIVEEHKKMEKRNSKATTVEERTVEGIVELSLLTFIFLNEICILLLEDR